MPIYDAARSRLHTIVGGSAIRQRWAGIGMIGLNLAMLTVATTMLVGRSYNPFLYFRF